MAADTHGQADAPDGRSFLFVSGSIFSGFVELGRCLSGNEAVGLCINRYQRLLQRTERIEPALYAPERVGHLRFGDTHYGELSTYPSNLTYLERYGEARYLGEAVNGLHRLIDVIDETFDDFRLIFVVRNAYDVLAKAVQQSGVSARRVQTGVDQPSTAVLTDWNACVEEIARRRDDPRIVPVSFEDLYERNVGWSDLTRVLGLSVERRPAWPVLRENEEGEALGLPLRELVQDHAAVDAYRTVLADVRARYRYGDDEGRADGLIDQVGTMGERFRAGPRAVHYLGDWPVIDYGYEALPRCNFMVRTAAARPRIVCLGSAATMGRFVETPYAAQLARTFDCEVSNLGFSGGSPDVYLGQPGVLAAMAEADATIIEFMSARRIENRLFVPASPYTLHALLRPPFADHPAFRNQPGARIFVARLWELAFEYLPEEAEKAAQEALAGYEAAMEDLIGRSRRPILLWFSQRAPEAETGPAVRQVFPHFVGRPTFARLAGLAPTVTVTSQAGLPQPLLHRVTGVPQTQIRAREPGLNTYYPSPEMHEEAAHALEDAVAEALSMPGGPSVRVASGP